MIIDSQSTTILIVGYELNSKSIESGIELLTKKDP
jgi:hypothetical protein